MNKKTVGMKDCYDKTQPFWTKKGWNSNMTDERQVSMKQGLNHKAAQRNIVYYTVNKPRTVKEE